MRKMNLSPSEKLTRDIKKKLIKNIAIAVIDLTSIIVNPFIAQHVIENTDSRYGKKALRNASGLLMVYQGGRLLEDVRSLKRVYDAYNASIEMIDDVPLIDVLDPTINLPPSEWIVHPEDIIVDSEDEYIETDEDGYVKGGFEYIVHIGEDIPYDDGIDDDYGD